MSSQNVHLFTMRTIDGKDKSLADYKGKVLLIINTASECGYTPQYKGMKELYHQYKDKGFEILAFPSNNFGSQEPGTNPEIKEFCSTIYQVDFPLFEKIETKGDQMAPLYKYLTEQSDCRGEISWNFNKFLVDKEGNVVARFDSDIEPMSPKIIHAIKEQLAK